MNQQQTREYYRDSSAARWAALIVVCIGSFLTPLSLSSVHIATPALANDLQADAILVSWVPTAFLLSNVITLLPVGRLADIWGRKRTYLAGSILFAIFSILAGFAPNIELLLVTRVLQGVAASMIFGCTLAIVTSVFEGGQRGGALGLTSAAVYLGLTCGPLIGGWLTETFGWRSVFFFPVPLSLLGIVLLVIKLKGEWRGAANHKVDRVGTLLFAVGAITLFLGISGLPAPGAIVTLVVSFVLLGLFVKHQEITEFPLVRLSVVAGNKVFSRSLLASILMYGANYPLIFLLSLYLQFVRGMTAIEAGKLMLLQALTMAIVAPIAGRLSDRHHAPLIASGGCIVVAVGFGILQWLSFDTPVYVVCVALVVLGIGHGLFSTPNNSAAMGAVAEERLGIASSLLSLSRVIGNMLGTAVLLLLMTLYIGAEQIEVEHYPALLSVIKVSLVCSLLFSIFGAVCSLARGKSVPASPDSS